MTLSNQIQRLTVNTNTITVYNYCTHHTCLGPREVCVSFTLHINKNIGSHDAGYKNRRGVRSTDVISERVAMPLLMLLLLVLLVQRSMCLCRLRGQIPPPEMSRTGDLMLGGIFTFYTEYSDRKPTFQTLPSPPKCMK